MCLRLLKQATALVAFLAVLRPKPAVWPDSGEGHRPVPLDRGGEEWNVGRPEKEGRHTAKCAFTLFERRVLIHGFAFSAQGAAVQQKRYVMSRRDNYSPFITSISHSATEGMKMVVLFLLPKSKDQFQKEEFYVTQCEGEFAT